jgi:predicted RNA-binding protein YlxR (DUF448 family)
VSAAARMRNYRRREKADRGFYVCGEFDKIALADALVRARLLDRNKANDRKAVTAALTRMVQIFYEENKQ